MRGRPRVPAKVLEARGSWRAGTLGRDSEPSYLDGSPDHPPFISGEALEEWNRLVGLMVPAKTLTKADRMALAVLCETWADFVDACADYVSAVGKQKRLARINKRVCAEAVLKAAAQFGLTPSARSRVQAVEGKDGGSNQKARFFKAS